MLPLWWDMYSAVLIVAVMGLLACGCKPRPQVLAMPSRLDQNGERVRARWQFDTTGSVTATARFDGGELRLAQDPKGTPASYLVVADLVVEHNTALGKLSITRRPLGSRRSDFVERAIRIEHLRRDRDQEVLTDERPSKDGGRVLSEPYEYVLLANDERPVLRLTLAPRD